MVRLDLGLSDSQRSALFDSIDSDGSGAIDYAEYAAALWHAHGTGPGSQSSSDPKDGTAPYRQSTSTR